MELPDFAIRSAVYSALTSPRLTYQNKQVKVFDSLAENGTKGPFIVLDGQQNIPQGPKGMLGYASYLTFRVIDVFAGGTVSRKRAEEVANLALGRILPGMPDGAIPLAIAGWTVWRSAVSTRDSSQVNGSGTECQKIITLTLNVFKNV